MPDCRAVFNVRTEIYKLFLRSVWSKHFLMVVGIVFYISVGPVEIDTDGNTRKVGLIRFPKFGIM